MPRNSNKAGKTKSAAEEADWYATVEGRRQTQREFTRALREGTLRRSKGLKIGKTGRDALCQLMQQARENSTRAISLRIAIVDLERAKQIAEKAGVGYQNVLQKAIREGLRAAGG